MKSSRFHSRNSSRTSMQKLTYINAYGDSVVFGGDPPQLLRSVSGFSRPDGKIVTVQGAYQDGTTAAETYTENLSVMVTGPLGEEPVKRTVVSPDGSRKLEITAVSESGQLQITPDVHLLRAGEKLF